MEPHVNSQASNNTESVNNPQRFRHPTEEESNMSFNRVFKHAGIGTTDENGVWHPPGAVPFDTNRDKKYRSPDRDKVLKRARAYVTKMDPAISGEGGHGKTFRVACELVIGFGLSTFESMEIMREYNQRCQPLWSEKELLHKVDQAKKKPGNRGHRLDWKETESIR